MRQHFRIVAIVVFLLAATSHAEDAFYRVPIKSLKLVDGALAEWPKDNKAYQLGQLLEPTVQVDGSGASADAEAYFTFENGNWTFWDWAFKGVGETALVVRAPAGKDVTGTLYLPNVEWKSLTPIRFIIAATAADPKQKYEFYQTKTRHYDALAARGLPGAAWFRHQAREAGRAIGADVKEQRQWTSARENEIEDTYALFTGGRAVSENLQLDRALLPRPGSDELVVPIETIKGITVKEFDWKPLIAGRTPALDPLASMIPADQHAVFFPTFEAATKLMDEIDRQGAPILQQAETRSEDAGVKARYHRQLCLPLTRIGRLLGPQLIAGMAFTGGDPYLRVGSDVAVLFQPKDLNALRELLTTQMGLNAGAAAAVSGEANGIAYKGYLTPDRSICAYLATVGDTVVVTNSLVQLQRIADVHAGKSAAMGAAPEYVFFRERYRRGEGDESGFIVMTDAAIRRWCSPRWRIGDSRRTRAAAVMAEAQARHVNELVLGKAAPAPLPADADFAGAGPLNLGASGVTSPVYGSLEFMTPISELPLARATQSEADTYNRWRDTYQQNWKNYFDPIAVRLSHAHNTLGADVTVMPLIASSEYQQLIAISEGAAIKPDSADPHGALLQMVLAINGQSQQMKTYGAMLAPFVPQLKVEPFSWIGPTASLYVDNDPALEEAAKAEKPEEFFNNNSSKIPVAIRIDSTDGLKMAMFLTALHGFIDQSAPGAAKWETLDYKDKPYVRISEANNDNRGARERFAVYYTTVTGALLITPNEALLKRAIDRRFFAASATAPATKPSPATQPWLGANYCMQLDGAGLRKILSLGVMGSSYRTELQGQSWSNLPILNEWKHRFPELDPVVVHERLWQTRLIDPAGGNYTWNAALQSMESSVYGSPANPKAGPAFPPAVQNLQRANFGITFENQGLRARVELQREE